MLKFNTGVGIEVLQRLILVIEIRICGIDDEPIVVMVTMGVKGNLLLCAMVSKYPILNKMSYVCFQFDNCGDESEDILLEYGHGES